MSITTRSLSEERSDETKGAQEPTKGALSTLDLLEAEELERPALPQKSGEVPPEQLRLEQARALAKQNPIAVANIIKTWVNGSEG